MEFLEGQLVVHQNADLPYAVLTNDTYASSLTNLNQYRSFGGTKPIPLGFESPERFVRATFMTKYFNAFDTSSSSVNTAFKFLDSVNVLGYTKWQIVYDQQARSIHFKTALQGGIYRFVNLDEFSFHCTTLQKAFVYPLERFDFGNVRKHFMPFDEKQNRDSVDKALVDFNDVIPSDSVDMMANYPQQVRCLN